MERSLLKSCSLGDLWCGTKVAVVEEEPRGVGEDGGASSVLLQLKRCCCCCEGVRIPLLPADVGL